MKINKQARREAKALFRASQVNGVLDEARVKRVIEAVLKEKPRGYVAILSHFQRLVRLDIDRRTARVESVVALDDAQQNGVRAVLAKRYGGGLTVTFAQNPALIGGMRIKVGSDVFDGSIRSRLAQLQEA